MTNEEPLREKFERLKREWLDDMEDMSVIDFTHDAYQQIIRMGPPAIPFLLHELQQESGYWFWALRAITGEDAAQPGDDYDAAVAAWLRWGRNRGKLRAVVRP
jgi:hypothetical protein